MTEQPTPDAYENLYDAVIIGGGPAGLTAALYLGRARYRVLVIEKDRFGGQIATTSEVVNYPGVLSASGEELGAIMRQQAANFGADFKTAEVRKLDMEGHVKVIHTNKGDFRAFAVLLATSAAPRHVGFDGEEDYFGHGVSYCATCDAEFFTDKEVLVVGGGFQAAEESVYLAKFAKHVTILVRKDAFSCAASAIEEVERNPKIEVRYHSRIKRVSGDTVLRTAVIENIATEEREIWRPANPDEAFGIFIFAGSIPSTLLVNKLGVTDEDGYVITDDAQITSCAGLFAAGDVCRKALRQVATAVGEAALAATSMERYIKQMQRATGLVPEPNPIVKPRTFEDADHRTLVEQKAAAGTLFSPSMVDTILDFTADMPEPLTLRLSLNDLPVSHDVRCFAEELAKLTDKVNMEIVDAPTTPDLPRVDFVRANGTWTGVSYHGVPLGHEFEAFIEGLLNASDPGLDMDEETIAAIRAVAKPLSLQVVVGTNCTYCPDLVRATEQMAVLNDNITAHIYDIAHFPDLQQRYNILGVPFLIVNDGAHVEFGRRSIEQILEMAD